MSGDEAPAGRGGPPAGGSAAFFDLDKTVIARASMAAFRRPLYTGGLLSRRSLIRALFAQVVYLHLGAGELRQARLRQSLLGLTKGWQRESVARIVEEAIEAIVEPIIFAEALELIAEHRAAGRRVVIVSASPEEIVVPLGRHLGVEDTISSRAAVDADGRYTGEIAFFAYGEAKAEAIRRLGGDGSIDLAASYAYSDAVADLPMLEAVGHPIAVNPDRALLRVAREREWEVRHFTRPVRLPERVRNRVRPLRSASAVERVALGAAALALCGSAVALRWWLRGTRREWLSRAAASGAAGLQLARRRRAAMTPHPTSSARITSFFTMARA